MQTCEGCGEEREEAGNTLTFNECISDRRKDEPFTILVHFDNITFCHQCQIESLRAAFNHIRENAPKRAAIPYKLDRIEVAEEGYMTASQP